jgi:hypothetical protein
MWSPEVLAGVCAEHVCYTLFERGGCCTAGGFNGLVSCNMHSMYMLCCM